MILDIIRKEPQITRKSLSEKTGLSEDGIKYHLARLEKVADKWRDATFEFIERQAHEFRRAYDRGEIRERTHSLQGVRSSHILSI